MTYFDQIYTRLFPKDKQATKPVVVDHLLKRSETFLKQYTKWKSSDEASQLLTDVSNSYQSALIGVGRIPSIVLHQSTNSNGFAISYDEEYDKNAFPFLLDYLAEKVKSLGYRSVINKQTLKEKDNDVEKKELHYLKPKPGFVEPIDQKFGNIQIEFIAYNDEPSRIKFIANTYSDRKYTDPVSFNSLINQVLV